MEYNYLTGIVFKKNNTEKKISKVDFSINRIEDYLINKKFLIDLNSLEDEQVFIILSSLNEGYNIYNGLEKNTKILINNIIHKIPKTSFVWEDKRKSYPLFYIVISLKDLDKLESILFEVCLIFKFSSFMGLKNNIKISDIQTEVNRFTLSSIFNSKRWKNLSNWQLFFDGEHLTGEIINSFN